jgi:hypothetical protein
MDLQTARDLKQELRTFLDSTSLRPRSDGIGLGVGVTSRPGHYVIAVRGQSEEAVPHDIVEMLRTRTANEIDVRFTGRIEVRPPVILPNVSDKVIVPGPPRRRPVWVGGTRGSKGTGDELKIGASIGHYTVGAGTLGFFARRRSDSAVGIVSNNHVLAAEDRGKYGDEILHPGPADRGQRSKYVIATLDGSYPLLKGGTAGVDCAFALLKDGVPYDPASLQMGQRLKPPSSPEDGQRLVSKIGRTTLRTFGHIKSIELDRIDVYYGIGMIRYAGQVEIESSSPSVFSLSGDSGSLIFGPEGNALALLFATSPIGGAWKSGLTYANPIDTVLKALDVSLLV